MTTTITVGQGTFSSPQGPAAVAVDEAAHTAYVTNLVGGTVSVIDTQTNTVTTTITVGPSPYAVAVEPTTGTVFVANSGDGTVSVLTAR